MGHSYGSQISPKQQHQFSTIDEDKYPSPKQHKKQKMEGLGSVNQSKEFKTSSQASDYKTWNMCSSALKQA